MSGCLMALVKRAAYLVDGYMLHVPPVVLGVVPEVEVDDDAVQRQSRESQVLSYQTLQLLPDQLPRKKNILLL